MRGILSILIAVGAIAIACGSAVDSDPASGPTASTGGSSASSGSSSSPQRIPGWETDLSNAIIDINELTRGQRKDGIPSIDSPKFIPVSEVDFLGELEPVVAFREGDDARAYPLQILIWHEIVNDVVGGRPVAVTFCPLCNTAITFDRTVDGRVLDFGVSGFLRNSDLVMFDRPTETWWQQATGQALAGFYVGTDLELLPSSIVSWADFKAAFPEGQVLSLDTGFNRSYGSNPYPGYDDVNSSPFLFDGEFDDRLSAMDRVVTVEIDGDVVAYPFSRLESQPVVSDVVGGVEIVVLFKFGTASALDLASIADSRDIGSAAVYSPILADQQLTFTGDGSSFQDEETGSTWDVFGRAIDGPLEGESLEPIVSGSHFWFAWAAFQPDTRVWDGT